MSYGPKILFRDGEFVVIEICSIIQNDAGNGYTAVLATGGVISLQLTASAQQEHRRRSRQDWPQERREAVLQVIDVWKNATGSAYKHGLEWHAARLGVRYSEVKAGCFENPGRVAPPLRLEYERGLARRRDTFNTLKKAGRIGGHA